MAAAEQDTDDGIADGPAGTKPTTSVQVALPMRGDAELLADDDLVSGELELDDATLTFFLRPEARVLAALLGSTRHVLAGATAARTAVVGFPLTELVSVRVGADDGDEIVVQTDAGEVAFRVGARQTWIDAIMSIKAGTAELIPTGVPRDRLGGPTPGVPVARRAPVASAPAEPEVDEVDEADEADEVDEADEPDRRDAAQVARAQPTAPSSVASPQRWIRRGVALFALAFGWLFIALSNRFHFSPAILFVCLGWVAIVAATYFLWRAGAAAAEDIAAEGAWWKPAGKREELEREKRALLKAIKEVEFDQQLRKLSQHDADEMVAAYRARAIQVIKALDALDDAEAGGHGDTVADHIDREVRARMQVRSDVARGKKAAPATSKTTSNTRKASASKGARS